MIREKTFVVNYQGVAFSESDFKNKFISCFLGVLYNNICPDASFTLDINNDLIEFNIKGISFDEDFLEDEAFDKNVIPFIDYFRALLDTYTSVRLNLTGYSLDSELNTLVLKFNRIHYEGEHHKKIKDFDKKKF